MRKLSYLLIIYIAVGIAWIFISPFVQGSFTYAPPSPEVSLERLTHELPEVEKLLKVGTNKQLSQRKVVTDWAICYVHGFTASPMELQPVISQIADTLGANLFITRLSGHGLKDATPMGAVKAQDWVNDTLECLAVAQKIGRRTILMGTSFGGTLSTLVALNAPTPPDALILVAPNFGIQNKASFLLAGAMAKPLTKFMFGDEREFLPVNDEHGYYWTTRHPSIALKHFMHATLELKKQDHSRLNVPTLIVYAPKDEVLDVSQIEIFYERINPPIKNMVTEPEWDQHVLAGDIVNPKGNKALHRHVVNFIKKSL